MQLNIAFYTCAFTLIYQLEELGWNITVPVTQSRRIVEHYIH